MVDRDHGTCLEMYAGYSDLGLPQSVCSWHWIDVDRDLRSWADVQRKKDFRLEVELTSIVEQNWAHFGCVPARTKRKDNRNVFGLAHPVAVR